MIALALAASFTLTPLPSGVTVRLQAVSVAGDDVVWASGLEGTFVRSVDGGATWNADVVSGAEGLQFRDVHAVDANTAYLLSAGSGAGSRIYKTVDGGMTWSQQFVNSEPEAFFDCMDFWDSEHGIAFSDSVEAEMIVIQTTDGESWERIPPGRLPSPLPGEGGFAASGTCVTTIGESTAFIAMGVGGARLLRTSDRGQSWEIVETPVPHENETSGLTSVAFQSDGMGVAAGGDISAPKVRAHNIAISEDVGLHWRLVSGPSFPGAVYGITYVPTASDRTLVAVGPGGISYSTDNGSSWWSVTGDSYWGVATTRTGSVFVAGPEGRLGRIEFHF